jgi:hypothetical protein
MKMKKIITFIIVLGVWLSCSEDKKIVDPIFEFVSLRGAASVNLGEADYDETGYPLVVQLWAARPYQENIAYTLEITPTNSAAGVDFGMVSPSNFKILAGHITDTVWVKTIDNATGTDLNRTFEVKITSIGKSEIGVGLGPNSKTNTTVAFKIIDDECSETTVIYNSSLKNSLSWGYNGHVTGVWDEEKLKFTATGSLSGNILTVTGDALNILDFRDEYPTVSIPFTLTPNSPGAPKGKATFGTLDLGLGSDGYIYRLLEIGEGTYDVCSRTVTTLFDVQYDNGGTWAHYYYVGSTFSTP